MELATEISLVFGLIILVLFILMVATEDGSPGEGSSSSQSADHHVQELHRQAEAGRRQMDAISDDYLRKVQEVLWR